MWKSLGDKVYRHAYAAAHVGDFLAMQIHSMRLKKGWTQKELADRSGNTQPQVSKFETSCNGINLTSLQKVADAFDVALIVKFIPYSQLARETISARADQDVPSFDDDSMLAIGFPENSVVPVEARPPSARKNGDRTPAYFRKFPETSTGLQTVRVS